jgi:hypothetical protein
MEFVVSLLISFMCFCAPFLVTSIFLSYIRPASHMAMVDIAAANVSSNTPPTTIRNRPTTKEITTLSESVIRVRPQDCTYTIGTAIFSS